MNPVVNILHKQEFDSYDDVFPYLSDAALAELAFFNGNAHIARKPDQCEAKTFNAVRELLAISYDCDNFGSENWNPFGKHINPGMTAAIKPNLVMHENLGGNDLYAMISHPAVIAAICVYVALALKATGEIIICDSPQWNCNWDTLLEKTRLDELCEELSKRLRVKITVVDLRMYEAVYDSGNEGLVSEIRDLAGDPAGYAAVDLEKNSAMENWRNFRNIFGSDYDRRAIRRLHKRGKHVYIIANSLLQADCVINLPKLKTHKKAGITCAMKNLVGAVGDKNCLPHFRIGFGDKGDEAAAPAGSKFQRLVKRIKHKLFWIMNDTLMAWHYRWSYRISAMIMKLDARFNTRTGCKYVYRDGLTWGNWCGNKTIGPLTADLNTIFTYADKSGTICTSPVSRKMINIVDGIIAGQNSGPLSPQPKPLGMLMLSENTYANDYVAARLMGFDPEKIHGLHVTSQINTGNLPLGPNADKISVRSNSPKLENCLSASRDEKFFAFTPHKGWVGYIEIDSCGGQH